MSNIKINLDSVLSNSGFNIYQNFQDTFEAKKDIILSVTNGDKSNDMIGWQDLPDNQKEVVNDIKDYCNEARERFDYFVVLGVGGSALGAKVLFNSLCDSFYNLRTKDRNKAPKFFVLDNIDPDEINGLLEVIELDKTLFNVVSKSGGTTESCLQFSTFFDMMVDILGEQEAKHHFVFTTDKNVGVLSKLEKEEGFKTFYVPSNVGGRFSVLCPVGLLPACMLGIDIQALLQGAGDMNAICQGDKSENIAYKKAVLEYVLNQKGVKMIVTMPYSSKLKEFSFWYAQLLGESIGKKCDRQGNEINCGLTPVSALGSTDQHSQLQLYMEGPKDKLIVFLEVEDFGSTLTCESKGLDLVEFQLLKNVEFGKLLNTERQATMCGLRRESLPIMQISIPKLDAYNLGQLFMLAQYEIAFLGELYNINAYNQPGVEFGKKITLASLGKDEYSEYLEMCNMKKQF